MPRYEGPAVRSVCLFTGGLLVYCTYSTSVDWTCIPSCNNTHSDTRSLGIVYTCIASSGAEIYPGFPIQSSFLPKIKKIKKKKRKKRKEPEGKDRKKRDNPLPSLNQQTTRSSHMRGSGATSCIS
ncbi:uncharacterized protein BO95DRAFT_444241 [Aspergillus brunneoviolaceus CBS 621.78]|uniref:Uncharacterized protein n=1 Tax=Aspergillus brunneoviolaceus CBS 621.78 TaxID=1450534 RepID=A0ACD1G5D3_9EURO|nr:hypothetical protein BO95DRAFT_444241 [Aspergillus brunneoviolaceus CBS 621.78]RAH44373.1 hypothetical protein BO95DRAFT_444241 [Aspergillus brunneoviolaceus CBS 621.78]